VASSIHLALVHGEPGAFTAKVAPVDDVVGQILAKITDATTGYMSLAPNDKVAVMVNSLGATPLMELYVAARAARLWLHAHGLNPVRVYVGSFMTALDMTGLSITLCKIDQLRLARLDGPVGAPAWPAVARTPSVPAPVPVDTTGTSSLDPVALKKLEMLDSGLRPAPPETVTGKTVMVGTSDIMPVLTLC